MWEIVLVTAIGAGVISGLGLLSVRADHQRKRIAISPASKVILDRTPELKDTADTKLAKQIDTNNAMGMAARGIGNGRDDLAQVGNSSR